MPTAATLPALMHRLLEHQWLQIRDENWEQDIEGLVAMLVSDFGFVDNQSPIRLPTPIQYPCIAGRRS